MSIKNRDKYKKLPFFLVTDVRTLQENYESIGDSEYRSEKSKNIYRISLRKQILTALDLFCKKQKISLFSIYQAAVRNFISSTHEVTDQYNEAFHEFSESYDWQSEPPVGVTEFLFIKKRISELKVTEKQKLAITVFPFFDLTAIPDFKSIYQIILVIDNIDPLPEEVQESIIQEFRDLSTNIGWEKSLFKVVMTVRSSTAKAHIRSEEHTSELQSRGLISYAVFCLKKKKSNLFGVE